MKKTMAVILSLAVLLTGTAVLASGSDYNFWGGAGYTYNGQSTVIDTDTLINGAAYSSSVKPVSGITAELGCKDGNWGVRAKYDYYGLGTKTSISGTPLGVTMSGGQISGNLQDYYAQVMGFLSVSKSTDVYAGAGIGGISAKVSQAAITSMPLGGGSTNIVEPAMNTSASCWAVPVSVGANYFFAKNWAINVDCTYIFSLAGNGSGTNSYFAPAAGIKFAF